HANKRAIGKKSGVERRKRVLPAARRPGQNVFQAAGVLRQSGGEAAQFHTRFLRQNGRKGLGEESIDEHQPIAIETSEMELAQSLFGHARWRVIEEWLERQPRDRRNISESPVLILQGRKAPFSETGNASLANGEEPR